MNRLPLRHRIHNKYLFNPENRCHASRTQNAYIADIFKMQPSTYSLNKYVRACKNIKFTFFVIIVGIHTHINSKKYLFAHALIMFVLIVKLRIYLICFSMNLFITYS